MFLLGELENASLGHEFVTTSIEEDEFDSSLVLIVNEYNATIFINICWLECLAISKIVEELSDHGRLA